MCEELLATGLHRLTLGAQAMQWQFVIFPRAKTVFRKSVARHYNPTALACRGPSSSVNDTSKKDLHSIRHSQQGLQYSP